MYLSENELFKLNNYKLLRKPIYKKYFKFYIS